MSNSRLAQVSRSRWQRVSLVSCTGGGGHHVRTPDQELKGGDAASHLPLNDMREL